MTLEVTPFPLPPSADAEMLKDFGRYVRGLCESMHDRLPRRIRLPREVKGVHPGKLTPEQFHEIHDLLYKVCSSTRPTCLPDPHLPTAARCSLVPRCGGYPRGTACTHQSTHLKPTQ